MRSGFAVLTAWLGWAVGGPGGIVATQAAEVPELDSLRPVALAPGATIDWTLQGRNLRAATNFWTSLGTGAEVEWIPDAQPETRQLKLRMTLKDHAPLGVAAVRVAGPDGLSNPLLFLVDDLAIATSPGGDGSAASPWELAGDGGWQGTLADRQSRFFLLRGPPGASLDLEVVAGRLGSKLDPLLRVLESDGAERAWQDDAPGLSPDCRLRTTFDKSGMVQLELRDATYRGGGDSWFWLRAGHFPLVAGFYPSVASALSDTPRRLLGEDAATAVPLPLQRDEAAQWYATGARLPTGGAVALVRLPSTRLPLVLETEPNDLPDQAVAASWPAMLCGTLTQPGDRDFFRFHAGAGQKLSMTTRTRALGLACDVWIELRDVQNKRIAGMGAGESEEGSIEHRFEKEGDYLLLVEEINRGGGPEVAYGVELDAAKPSFTLDLESNQASVVAGGVVELKVKASRSDYAGPILLSVEGLPEGENEKIRLEGDLLAEKKDETTLKITLPEDLPVGWHELIIRGRSKDRADLPDAVATTIGAWQSQLGKKIWHPAGWETRVLLWTRPP